MPKKEIVALNEAEAIFGDLLKDFEQDVVASRKFRATDAGSLSQTLAQVEKPLKRLALKALFVWVVSVTAYAVFAIGCMSAAVFALIKVAQFALGG